MPLLSQTGASSSALIGREALKMSVSPAQNFLKPPPVPDGPAVTWTLGCSLLNSSPRPQRTGSRRRGADPDRAGEQLVRAALAPRGSSPEPSPPQAATPSASAAVTAASTGMNRSFLMTLPSRTEPRPSQAIGRPVTDAFPPCEKAVNARAGSGIRTRSGCG